jgi:hypothetical protein
MLKDEEIGILSGLLDFYSSKSNTHAGFVVAGIFGMYALLVFYESMPSWGFLISYIALLLIELYAFANFRYYGEYAECIKRKLDEGTNLDISEADRKGMGRFIKYFLIFRTLIIKYKLQYLILGVLWGCAAIVPLILRAYI